MANAEPTTALRFARTHDPELVHMFLREPKVALWATEDGVPAEALLAIDPRLTPDVWYVVALDERKPIGLFIYEPRTTAKFVVHLAIAPNQWFRALDAFKGANKWACQYIGMERIAGEIPSDNSHALRLAKRAGFELVGTESHSYRRGGKLLDVRIVGINKEQACQ
jgi:RimJ/RimL family protein N-acetyltransferase